MQFVLLICALSITLPLAGQTAAVFKVTPATLAFSHQIGDTKLPVAQILAVAGTVPFAAALTGGPWLSITPVTATAPASARVSVNPTSLAVGTYSATITIITAEQAPQTAVIPVSLVVRAAPSTLTANVTSATVNYVRGAPPPEPVGFTLTTNGAVLSYTTAAAGGTWLTVTPKSGVAFPAFPGTVGAIVNPLGLPPGTYKGTVTVSAPQAVNKTITLGINLNVSPGAPSISSIWPSQIPQGSPATTVTIQGDNFFPGSIVKTGNVTLPSTYVGVNVLSAVIPLSLLNAPVTLPITVINPGIGGGDAIAQNVTVVPPGPIIGSVVNSASFATDAIAPGLIVALFGTGLGPDRLTTFTATNGVVPPSLAGTRVLFGNLAAPVLYTSANQVSAVVPYGIAPLEQVDVRAEFNGVRSQPVVVPVSRSAPGIFTANSAGSGPIAGFQFDEVSGVYSLITETAAAPRGSIIVFYATGEGLPNTATSDGLIITQASEAPNASLGVQIGVIDAEVLYAGGVTGLVSGLIQLNVRIPETTPNGKAIPVFLFVNGRPSQPTATIAVK